MWRLTSVYGEAQISERYKTWDMLKGICGMSTLPWLCLGDFNEVLHAAEHEGVGTRTLNQMQGFREAVDVCNLLDLGYKGHFWTWEKKVTGGTYTRVRLDRALGSAEWSAQFPLAFVTHIDTATLDHSALHVQLYEEVPRVGNYQF
jgi:endonuclease/exonuclease/phosphatase family metal-dependent hydrolase